MVRRLRVGSCGVYLITNTINGKTYIGSSSNIERRWRHRYNKHLTSAMAKYGRNNFSFEILLECSRKREDLIYFEQVCMGLFMPKYNKRLTADSNLGIKHLPFTEAHKKNISIALMGRKHGPFSEEWLKNLSASHMGNKSHTGRMLSAEHRLRISNSNMGKIVSEDTRKKISVSKIGNKHCLGRVVSGETRAKMSKSISIALAAKRAKLGHDGVSWKVG